MQNESFTQASAAAPHTDYVAEIVHADIFFFITSIAVIVLSVVVTVVLYYVIMILRDVRMMIKQARKAGDELEQDIHLLRSNLVQGGVRFQSAIQMIMGFVGGQIKKVRRTRRKTKEE